MYNYIHIWLVVLTILFFLNGKDYLIYNGSHKIPWFETANQTYIYILYVVIQ